MASGHALSDILTVTYPGMPYPGWTLPQLRLYEARGAGVRLREAIHGAALMRLGVGSIVIGKDWKKAWAELVKGAEGGQAR